MSAYREPGTIDRTEIERASCKVCPHKPHVGLCTGRMGGTAWTCMCSYHEPFCACGRRESECDGSRAGCRKSALENGCAK